jgi:hypothetical protein
MQNRNNRGYWKPDSQQVQVNGSFFIHEYLFLPFCFIYISYLKIGLKNPIIIAAMIVKSNDRKF